MDDVKNKIKNIFNNKKIKFIVKFVIILLFVMLSLNVSKTHEHWSDEAQSFLLAKDTSFFEMFKYMKYEGTPPLWVLVIKLFIFLGGTYKTFFVLPIIFNTIGLILFEYKVKCPWYIKIIFPFTYFIFYQYTIIARSYSLIFPLLMCIVMLYKSRYKKSFLYALILFIFMNISLHTLIVVGSLYFIYTVDSIKNGKIKNKKIIISIIVIFLELLLTAILTYPAADCSYKINIGRDIFHIISEATVGSDLNKYLEIIITFVVLGIIIFTTNMEKQIKLCIILFPVLLVLMFICYKDWHVGIIWLVMFSYLLVTNQINDNRLIKVLVMCILIVQCSWSISSIKYDYNNKYSASLDVYKYLSKYNLENMKIYGFGFAKTSIQGYFDENIFDNKLSDKGFYIWALDNKELPLTFAYDSSIDMYIVSMFDLEGYSDIITYLDNNNDYKKMVFEGNTYIKNRLCDVEGFLMYEKNKEK